MMMVKVVMYIMIHVTYVQYRQIMLDCCRG